MSYEVWEWTTTPGCCTLADIENVERVYALNSGVSLSADFPRDALFRMDPDHPRAVKLPEQIPNLDRLLVVSGAIKDFLEGENLDNVEFLQVAIWNHKGRVASEDYWIVNTLTVVDCVDKEASDIKWNALDADKIASCESLVLHEEQIDSELRILRPKHLTDVVLVRRDLAEALTIHGFSGVDLVVPDELVR